jgi:hypothetical protein
MPKEKKIKFTKSKFGGLHEDWLAGKNNKLKGGDVVQTKSESKSIGVIQFGLNEIETYAVKWYIGPNPWDSIEGVVSSSTVEVVNIPNPLKYKWSQRVPGPSSDQIDALEAKFAAKRDNRPKTAKEVEQHLAILEEELSKKKKNEIDETKVDSIVDETLDEDLGLPIDGVTNKITNLLDEE